MKTQKRKAPKPEARTVILKVRVTPSEHQSIVEKTERLRIRTVSDWLRISALSFEPKAPELPPTKRRSGD